MTQKQKDLEQRRREAQKVRNKEYKRASKKTARERKVVATKAKYGGRGKPAPVVTKLLDGEVAKVSSQAAITKRRERRAAKVFAPRLNAQARSAGFESYSHYLLSPGWAARRAEVLVRDHHCCVECGSVEHLAVHHLTYARLGSERLGDLVTLCRSCHRAAHGKGSKRRRVRNVANQS